MKKQTTMRGGGCVWAQAPYQHQDASNFNVEKTERGAEDTAERRKKLTALREKGSVTRGVKTGRVLPVNTKKLIIVAVLEESRPLSNVMILLFNASFGCYGLIV